MSWQGVPVLVTGAGGFIGSHLVEALLERKARVRALVRYNSRGHWGHLEKLPPEQLGQLDVHLGDVTDPFYVRELVRDVEIVFHLAALIGIPYSYIAPASYVETNVKGTLHVLEACRSERIARLLHTSTSEVYGTAIYTPIDERHPLQGQSPYAASKIAADKLAESYYRSFGLPVAIARPFNTYGPRQSARAVIPTVVSQLLKGDAVHLGNLEVVRDFTFVSDIVRGMIAITETAACVGQVTNLGSGRGITVGALVQEIGQVMKKHPQVRVDEARLRPERSEVFELICDNSRARSLLGWKPQTLLHEGLQEVVRYVQANSLEYKAELFAV